MLRAERIQPRLRRANRVATWALLPAALGVGLVILSTGRSESLAVIGLLMATAGIIVGGVATLVAFVLTIGLFFSRTDPRL